MTDDLFFVFAWLLGPLLILVASCMDRHFRHTQSRLTLCCCGRATSGAPGFCAPLARRRATETLKWGEPAYVTAQSKTGSTIRIDWKKSKPSQYAMYFHCQTSLVDAFRTLFPNDFRYEGNRAIVFHEDDVVPVDELSFCIEAALTYRRNKAR